MRAEPALKKGEEMVSLLFEPRRLDDEEEHEDEDEEEKMSI